MSYVFSAPAPFAGTADEARANQSTHVFIEEWDGGGYQGSRCMNCDCRPGGTSSKYPCGTPVPRVTREVTTS